MSLQHKSPLLLQPQRGCRDCILFVLEYYIQSNFRLLSVSLLRESGNGSPTPQVELETTWHSHVFRSPCRKNRNTWGKDRLQTGQTKSTGARDVHGSDRIGSDRTLVGSDKNYRLSENPTIRSEVSNSRLNNIHIADMLLTDTSEVNLIIIYLTINQEKT